MSPELLLALPLPGASPPTSTAAPPGSPDPPGGPPFQSALQEHWARTANAEGHKKAPDIQAGGGEEAPAHTQQAIRPRESAGVHRGPRSAAQAQPPASQARSDAVITQAPAQTIGQAQPAAAPAREAEQQATGSQPSSATPQTPSPPVQTGTGAPEGAQPALTQPPASEGAPSVSAGPPSASSQAAQQLPAGTQAPSSGPSVQEPAPSAAEDAVPGAAPVGEAQVAQESQAQPASPTAGESTVQAVASLAGGGAPTGPAPRHDGPLGPRPVASPDATQSARAAPVPGGEAGAGVPSTESAATGQDSAARAGAGAQYAPQSTPAPVVSPAGPQPSPSTGATHSSTPPAGEPAAGSTAGEGEADAQGQGGEATPARTGLDSTQPASGTPAAPTAEASTAPVPSGATAGAQGAGATGASPTGEALDMQQLIESARATVELAARQGVAQARIALQPQELGDIRIHLSQTADGLLARITADSPAGAQALAGARAELHQSLSSLGVSLLRLDIGSAGPEAGGREGALGESREGSGSPAAAHAGEEEESDLPSHEGAQAPERSPAAGTLVDVLA